jgi:hypothetical protein
VGADPARNIPGTLGLARLRLPISDLIVLGLELAQAAGDVGPSALDQGAVGALDHPDACTHDPRQLEHRDTGRQRVARERRAQVVDPRRGPYAGRLDRRRPLAAPEVVQVQQATARRGEESRRVESRR